MQTGPVSPDIYISRIFESRAARDGAVVRRKVRDVERYAGRDRFLSELKRRGYTAIENAGQFVIFCNQEEIRLVR